MQLKSTSVVLNLAIVFAVLCLLFFGGGRRDLSLEKHIGGSIAVRVYYEIPSFYYRITGFGRVVVETTNNGIKKRLDPGVYYDFKGNIVWSWTETTQGGGLLEESYYAMKIEVSPKGDLLLIQAPNIESK